MNDYYRTVIERTLALTSDGSFDNALTLVDEALAKATLNEDRQWLRLIARHAGVMADAAGQPQRARGYYETALAHGEQDPWLMLGIALVCRQLDDHTAASVWCERSFEIASQRGDDRLAQLLLSKGYVRPREQ
jgi:hypothetical protein